MSVIRDNLQAGPESGAAQQCFLAPLSGQVPAGGNLQASVKTLGWQKGALGITSSQAGSISVQRYVDQAGTMPIGAAITVALTANTPAAVYWADAIPFGSLQITVANTGGSPANLTAQTLLLQSI